MTRRSSTIRTTISPTSRKNMIENTGRFGVSTVFESSVSKSFSLVILFFKRKARKARNRESVARERKRRKRRFWDQWYRVDVKERLTERYLCESEESQKILFSRVSENSTLLFEISEDTWNEELNKLFFLGKFSSEKIFWMSTSWRARTWSEEIQNTHYSSHNDSLNLKDDNYWKPINRHI